MDVSQVPKLTVALLKQELESRGLATTGKKADLAARLSEALSAAAPMEEAPVEEAVVEEAVVEEAAAEVASEEAPAVAEALVAETAEDAPMTDVQKDLEARKKRAARFGLPVREVPEKAAAGKTNKSTEDRKAKKAAGAAKLKERSERFGLPVKGTQAKPSTKEKAARTGGKKVLASMKKLSPDEMLKVIARSKRFGTPLPPGIKTEEEIAKDQEEAAKAKALKDEEAARLQARRERFAAAASAEAVVAKPAETETVVAAS